MFRSDDALFSGLETREMRKIGCSLRLQNGVQFEPRVLKLDPCNVVVPQDNAPEQRVRFQGCTVLQLNPTGSGTPAMPEIITIGGPCLFTAADKKDFRIMMRTRSQSLEMRMPSNGEMDWPDVEAFMRCPCCGNRASPDSSEEYWLIFYPLLQAGESGIGVRTICRLTCQDCFEDLVDGLSIFATTPSSATGVQVPLIEAVEDQGPITFMERAHRGMGSRDGKTMNAYLLYQAWEMTGAWQTLQNELASSLQSMMSSGGLNVEVRGGRTHGSQGDSPGAGPVWKMKRESKAGKQCNGPGCKKVHRSRTEGKKIRLKPCSGCRDALYCTTKCQENAWPDHKVECRAKRKREKEEAEKRKAKEEEEEKAKMESALASFVPLSLNPQGGGGKKKKKAKGGKNKKKKGKK